MDLERVIGALAPIDVIHRASPEIRDLAYDSRAVVPGALFFCVPGERTDGHAHAAAAVAAGAAALVVERPLDLPVPQLVVPDSRRAMAAAARPFFGEPSRDLVVAGVTGTNGKTTTTFLLFAILAAARLRPGLLGTIETRVGGERRPATRTTPEAIDLQRALAEMRDAGDRSCALEATSHGAALGRLDGTRFGVLVFTNLGRDHLDFHGTVEQYFEAKRRLFMVGERPPAAVNIADPHGRALADELRRAGAQRLMTFGFADDAEVRAEDLELSPAGSSFSALGLDVQTQLLGRFNVENVLGVMAAARLLELPDEAVIRGIASLRGVPGRFEPVDEGQPFTVVIDYAHTPQSLENVLAMAHDAGRGRVICVFGCGGDRDRGKRALMGEIASRGSDLAIVTSDNPRSEDPGAISAEILAGVTGDVEVELDRRSAIERGVGSARPGDVVVIAGKGHERGQEVAGRTLPFDDRDVAREALRRLAAQA